MATSGVSDYGVTLSSASALGATFSTVGELVKLDFGEIKGETVELTNHASPSGYREIRPAGLFSVSELSATLNFSGSASISAWKTDMDAKTLKYYKVTFPTSASCSMTFQGFPVSWKPSNIDAQSPNPLQYEIKIQPTDVVSIA